jgi:hypothetical protein
MPKNLYCEPCRRLLRGELSVIYEINFEIKFSHHHDSRSFVKAMQLPCAICRLAWAYAQSSSSKLSRGEILGSYIHSSDGYTRELYFYDKNSSERSETLNLEPWPSE